MDWFSALGLTLIVLIVLGLIAYSVWSHSPAGPKIRLPHTANSVE